MSSAGDVATVAVLHVGGLQYASEKAVVEGVLRVEGVSAERLTCSESVTGAAARA